MGFIAGSAMTVLVGTARAEGTSDAEAAMARANAAQAQANDARDRADELAKAGGWPYKTGLIRGYERQATLSEAKADEARAQATGARAPSSNAYEESPSTAHWGKPIEQVPPACR
jgi:hypothetical protein